MATLVLDSFIEHEIRGRRAAWGVDKFDEVWEGVYRIPPTRNLEHQGLIGGFTTVFWEMFNQNKSIKIYGGVCVSDRDAGWNQNFRFPDVVVVLPSSRARDCCSHYCGGPDFLIEIISPFDQTRDKLPFYGKIGVRELLIVDRDPWCLELYQLHGEELQSAGKSRLEEPALLTSSVFPLSFRLLPGEARPQIEVTHHDGVQRWIV